MTLLTNSHRRGKKDPKAPLFDTKEARQGPNQLKVRILHAITTPKISAISRSRNRV